MSSTLHKTKFNFNFKVAFIFSSPKSFILNWAKILSFGKELKPFTLQSRVYRTLGNKAFENIVGKGENAGSQHFLLFPQCFFFLICPKAKFSFRVTFILSFTLDWSNILSFGIELSLLTLWEKEKVLVIITFSFSHYVFYSVQN